MSRFPSAAHLASWAGLAPAMYESAGKRTPAGRRRGNKWLTAMLVEAAGSVGRMHGKNYLAAQHARLTKRRGMSRAQIAVAHSILTTAYYMLKRDEPYPDLGPDGSPSATTKPTPAGWSPSSNARPHRPYRPSRLTRSFTSRRAPPDGADARPVVTYSRVCVGW